MIDRIGRILETSDVAEPSEWPLRVGVIATSNAKICGHLAGDRLAVYRATAQQDIRADGIEGCRRVVGILHDDWLAWRVGICRGSDGVQLINISLQRWVRPFAANEREGRHEVARQSPLNVQMPLRDVGQNGFTGDEIQGGGKEGNTPAAATNVPV